MRALCIIGLLCIALARPASAGREIPKGLSAEEVSQGWILLFDGATDYGWRSVPAGAWTVKDGVIEATGNGFAMLFTNVEFADFELKADVQAAGRTGLGIRATAGDTPDKASGTLIPLAQSADKWTTVSIRAVGNDVTLNGEAAPLMQRGDQKSRGAIALGTAGQGVARFRNIKIRPLGLKSIFNGKDLSGWKPVDPDQHKSVFSITPEGWLNIKNGNGEIQSESQFGDFALQLEIFSNGDHLNSGVFFREEPGKFWLGYEAQIRSQWEGDDRNKPVDYGTGGLYNRLPARRVVSSDREWYTMTVIATGNHIGIWVNGYQACDFTDTRPANESNARQGARTKAGVFGLQGHDPTTDMSFRNIRVVELPAASKP